MKKNLFALAVISFALTSCKKDETCEITMTTISGTYKVITAVYTAPGMPPVNMLANSDPCERDDLMILNENGSYEIKDTGTPLVCSPNNDYTGTWSLSGNTITVDGDVATIESFDCESLVYNGSPGFTPGDKATITIKKQ